MTSGANGPPFSGQGKNGSLRLRVRALAGAAQGRFEGSAVQTFLSQLGALDFANSIILFGSALLISVLPFVILRYNQTARPFSWKFTAAHLHHLMDYISRHEQQDDPHDEPLPEAA